MERCDHRPEWIKKRDNGDFYCTVCRQILYEQAQLFTEEEIEKQRRIDRLLRER